jgi:membrane-associated phospholipid phosphatase
MGTDIRPGIRFAKAAGPAALVIAVVIAVGFALVSASDWTSAEMGFLRSVSLLHDPTLDWFALGVNRLFGPSIASLIILLGVITVAGVTRRLSSAAYFFMIVAVPWLGNEVVKMIVHRPRPDIPSLAHPLIFEPGGLGYPSGHTTFATCLMIGVLLVTRGSRWRPALVAAAAVVSLATAASRVYLGVHYPTDVTASIVYSIAAVAVVNALWNLLSVPHLSRRLPVADELPNRGVPDAR